MEDRLNLNGKTFDHSMPYDSIEAMLCLPIKEKQQFFILVIFIFSFIFKFIAIFHQLKLKVPLRQGQSYYNYIGFQFQSDVDLDYNLLLSEPEIKSKYGDALLNLSELQSNSKIVSQIFSSIVGLDVLDVNENFRYWFFFNFRVFSFVIMFSLGLRYKFEIFDFLLWKIVKNH